MSDTLTHGFRVRVQPRFLPEHSNPSRWVFSYTVTISNEGSTPARLVSRHWIITDGWGTVEEVQGPGVIGETPHLQPGEGFVYTSFCPLPTPTGTMEGSYQMVADDGSPFDIRIGRFFLADPSQMN